MPAIPSRPVLWFLLLLLAAGTAWGQSTGPELIIDGTGGVTLGVPHYVAVELAGSQAFDVTSIAFSLDIQPDLLSFDPVDGDGDGTIDDVTFPLGAPGLASVTYDVGDGDGELDFLLANLSGLALPDGPLVELEFMPLRNGCLSAGIRFSVAPPASFGSSQGQDVPGTAVVIGGCLFADGFELGDLSAWSQAVL